MNQELLGNINIVTMLLKNIKKETVEFCSFLVLSKWFIIRISFFPVVKCPTLKEPTHGVVFPYPCTSIFGVNYGTDCFFMCNVSVGYRLEGTKNVSCLESGFWSADLTKISCRGIEFRCSLVILYFCGLISYRIGRVTSRWL